HDRFLENRTGLLRAFLVRHRAGDLERHFAGVDVMVRAVIKNRANARHRIPGHDAALHRFLDALLGRLDELARNRTAHDLVDELEIALRKRLEAHLDVPILALATRLTDELSFGLRVARDRLAIRDLRLPDVRLHAEL